MLLLSAFSAVALGNDVFHIEGVVTDKESGELIPEVSVSVKGQPVGCNTDSLGHYSISGLHAGDYTLVAELMGYATATRRIHLDRNQHLDFAMHIKVNELSEVVVSANRNETPRMMAPSLVAVLDSSIFSNAHAVCVADGLSFQPGVRVEDDCQNCGYKQARINGLDGHYSQVLIDSRPVYSALSSVYGLEQIPENMVERVEVLRGGGSALFGASAIGGTINIITREPEHNSASLSHSILSMGGTSATDNNTELNASIISSSHNSGAYVYGQNRYRMGYDHDGDGYTELPMVRTQSLGFRSFVKPNDNSKLSLQFYSINDQRRGGNKLDLPEPEANIAESSEHHINGGGLDYTLRANGGLDNWDFYASAVGTNRRSYTGGYGSDENPDTSASMYYSKTNDFTCAGGAQYSHFYKHLFFMPSRLTLGTEYSFDQLDDHAIGYDFSSWQTVRIASLLAQNEWKNDQWSLLLGGRLDKHNLIDNPIFSPRVNLRFNPSESISLRASYAGGFRAPQTFDEDLHIDMAGGERFRVHLADNLKEERSNSLSASADLYHSFGSVKTNLMAEAFFTDLSDAFAESISAVPDAEGCYTIERYNASGARVYGANVEARANLSRWLKGEAGLTMQLSRYKQAQHWSDDAPDEKKMFRSPDLYGYLNVSVSPLEHWSASVTGTYTGPMLVQHAAGSGTPKDEAVSTPDFYDMNLKLAYSFAVSRLLKMEVSAGVQNLFDAYQDDFDKGPGRDSAYIYGPSLPRSYFAQLRLNY